MRDFESVLYKGGRVYTETPDDEFVIVGKNPVVRYEYVSREDAPFFMHALLLWNLTKEQYERRQDVNKVTGMVDAYSCGEFDII